MRHPTPIEIEDHLMNRRVPVMDAHLETCPECERVARTIETLGEPLTWDIASLPDVAELDAALPDEASRSEILGKIDQAEGLRHSNPAEAVRICDETLRLPGCSAAAEDALHLSVLVLRERANAMRVLGDLPGTYETIRRARSLASQLVVSEYENAVLDYIEATVLFEQEDLDPIGPLARRAERALTRFGDLERAAKVRILTAAVEFRRGNVERACAMYSDLLESIEGRNPAMEAGVLTNIANCEVELRRHEEAQRHISKAAGLYQLSGMTTEVTRVRWLEARIAAARDELGVSEELYRSTEADFLAAGLELDAALVSLELVELLQRQGRSAEIIEIATRLASVFAEAGVRMSLATTLAALRDAALRGDDVSGPVAEVRSAIEELMTTS